MIKLIDPEGNEYEIKKPEVTIGRSPKSDIVVDDLMVSGRHAHLAKDGGNLMIHDDGSTNGTSVNGEDITAPTELKDGDKLGIGETVFTVIIPDESDVKATAVMKSMKSDVSETVKMGGSDEKDLLVDLDTAKPPPGDDETEELGNALEMAEKAYNANMGVTSPDDSMTEQIKPEAVEAIMKAETDEPPQRKPTIGEVKSGAMAVSEEDQKELDEAKAERDMDRADSDQGTMPMDEEDIAVLRSQMESSEAKEEEPQKPVIEATMPLEEEDMDAIKEAMAAGGPGSAVPLADAGLPSIPANEQPAPQPSIGAAPAVAAEVKNKGITLAIDILPGLFFGLPGFGWLYVGEQQRGITMLAIGGGLLLTNIILGVLTIFTGVAGLCFCVTGPAVLGLVGYSAYNLFEFTKENPEKFE